VRLLDVLDNQLGDEVEARTAYHARRLGRGEFLPAMAAWFEPL
jgi:hypothetical protein